MSKRNQKTKVDEVKESATDGEKEEKESFLEAIANRCWRTATYHHNKSPNLIENLKLAMYLEYVLAPIIITCYLLYVIKRVFHAMMTIW